jgi:hypothetical protein
MPNWVHNAVSFTAETKEQMDEFIEIMTSPRPYIKEDPDRQYRSLPYAPENLEYGEREFSFWNVVAPDESILHEYWGEQPETGSLAEALQNKTNFWYDWNIRNWGCKWDARVEDEQRNGDLDWSVMFETPWGPPLEFYQELAARFPHISMESVCIEEQGWGSIYIAHNGELVVEQEWDIPSSHAEHEATLGQYGQACRCEIWPEDKEYRYSDCPEQPEMASV